MSVTVDAFRLYEPGELRADGYPAEWHASIKHDVRERAASRCVRCHHPYRRGEHGSGEWTACDSVCSHAGPIRCLDLYAGDEEWTLVNLDGVGATAADARLGELADGAFGERYLVEARWRILTVHHLDRNKANCRWWNLAALCQRCHLTIQGRVQMARIWPWEHTAWFRPYVAGYYAHVYLGEDLTRDEVEARLDELLDLERAA